jgi:hypothetical protein
MPAREFRESRHYRYRSLSLFSYMTGYLVDALAMDIVYTTLEPNEQANFIFESKRSLPVGPYTEERRIYFAGAATSASAFLHGQTL